MREGFKNAILELGNRDDFLLLTGDHGYALFDEFRRRHPEKFINVGIAESNLVTMAAGLAKQGFRPLIYGLAAFLPNRVYEFLKLQVSLDALSITVVGDGGGLVYSTLGHSHQSLDDLALANSLPNFKVFSPSGDFETRDIILASSESPAPSYIRLGKTDGNYDQTFPDGRIEPYLARGTGNQNVALVGHGSMTSRLLAMSNKGLIANLDIWSHPTLTNSQLESMQKFNSYAKLIVVEEHLRHGGLYSLLIDSLAFSRPRVYSISASKTFHRGIGDYEWVLSQHGLDETSVERKINEIINESI